jgi:hypothetical protein
MSEGKLRCFGSPVFLKNRFGAGYKLAVTKSNPNVDNNSILSTIKSSINEATILSSFASEIIIQLPKSSSVSFGQLFSDLHLNSDMIGVKSYGISITSLEQIFIQLAKESKDKKQTVSSENRGETTNQMIHNSNAFQLVPRNDDDLDDEAYDASLPSASLAFLNRAYEIFWNAWISNQPNWTRSIPIGVRNDNSPEKSSDANIAPPCKGPAQEIELTTNYQNGAKSDDMPSASSVQVVVDDEEALTQLGSPTYERIPVNENCNNAVVENETPPRPPSSIALIAIQFIELMRKRYIISTRDLRGFIFQVLLPAVQIVLVLAILTVRVNPAGRNLKMDASIFPVRPVTPFSEYNNDREPPYGIDHLSYRRMNLVDMENMNTSEYMSR